MEINLSYVLTTFNKLPYLKEALQSLIKQCAEDEEIVVIDGKSNDGTAEYVESLFDRGDIHQYKSEEDKGEGHGFNKGILMARGKIIKLLTDDDVFDFDAIKRCKDYMLEHPNIDFLNTHGANCVLNNNYDIYIFTTSYIDQMNEWTLAGKPFAFCMLGAMFNRDSLPLLGLLNPSIKRTDAEYSLRITSQKIKMVWYTGIAYVRLDNARSNTFVYTEKIKEETSKLNQFYNVMINEVEDEISIDRLSVKKITKDFIRPVYRFFKPLAETSLENTTGSTKEINIQEAFMAAQKWLQQRSTDAGNVFYEGVKNEHFRSPKPVAT